MNIGCDDMDNEKIIKLQHFFSVDTKIKKEIYDIAPQSLNGYIDETSISEYTDKLNDSLIYILSELKCVALDVFGKESSIFNKVCYLEQDIKTNFYSCGFDIEKLKSFYQKYISNMEPSFIDDVKRSYIGYYFGGGGVSPLKKASTINEILHLMHSRIINNEGLLQSIPLLNKKDNQHNNTISLRGIRNPMFEQLFMMFPIDLDCGITDMVIINEKTLIMMVRDRGHALSIEVTLNKDNARIEYFIPKICNVEMVNKIPGVNKVNDDSIGTTGTIEVEVKDLPTALFNFISMVPTDMDIVHNYGRGI